MVETTSRYRLGKLNLVIQKNRDFWPFQAILASFWSILGKFDDIVLVDCAKHTEPIRTTRESLESLFGRLPNDTTMVGNG